ncbi:hypothetical protein EJ05DRAFT_503447 [Pseudovirgaria hyperparasitica]|uniref:lytic cellulose monooxygenase (C4-dehydrogenating) n=1 Tax=Pseudovirgaria hyperparasitica TaxID=470096 RepID=A0A6A6VWS6_9PEZI|nr:uncharacterized protein EJ05DRAFT_503447 [Pseudovirgaria hyperparasitica]KAF2755138.1 hypothetical protein EJ05DRAFT_503447 [Pseudovirgaria hyperparasitica]
MRPNYLVAIIALLPNTLAHYRFQTILTSPATPAYRFIRLNTNERNPVSSLSTPDIRCNTGTLASGPSTRILPIRAGTALIVGLDQEIYHAGPLNAYLSAAPTGTNLTAYDGSGDWFKIASLGPDCDGVNACDWAPTRIANWTVTVPSKTPPGFYLLRVEQIALHNAGQQGGVEFYLSCVQVQVEGTGDGKPGPMVKFPGAYKADDKAIQLDIYYPILMNYTAPGPSIWKGV